MGHVTSTQPLSPTVRLLELEAEAQDLLPDHTYKAVMLRISSKDSVQEQCEVLEGVVEEFKRGMRHD